jgi:hypothetical protein
VWDAAHNEIAALNGELAKACVQNPLEFRAAALAAVKLGSRPHDLDVDVRQAAEFCFKMMS